MSCYVMSCHVMSCHVMSCQVICSVLPCHVMSCYVMSCHVMSCYVMSCQVICSVLPCHVMSCYVMSCYVMSCHVFMYTCYGHSLHFIISSIHLSLYVSSHLLCLPCLSNMHTMCSISPIISISIDCINSGVADPRSAVCTYRTCLRTPPTPTEKADSH